MGVHNVQLGRAIYWVDKHDPSLSAWHTSVEWDTTGSSTSIECFRFDL
jgi:hypothetical protein